MTHDESPPEGGAPKEEPTEDVPKEDLPHEDVPYEGVAEPSWTDATEFTQGGATYITGTCPRCHGATTRRKGAIIVQGTKIAATQPFVIRCECGRTGHAGRPEKAALGCGAYWYSEPVQD